MSRNGVMETHRLPPNTMQITVFNSALGEKRAKESGLTVHGYGCLCCSRLSAGNKRKKSDICDFRIRGPAAAAGLTLSSDGLSLSSPGDQTRSYQQRHLYTNVASVSLLGA